MAMYVYADPPAVFRRWLAGQERPASPPASAEARRGQQVFLSGSCADCHAIRGTSASGYVGPDLTHLASRNTIGALTAPLGDADLRQWITGSQHLKPGNQMPDINLAEDDVRALVTYLKGLK
jgi:cytochrome c oxidase subunit 2